MTEKIFFKKIIPEKVYSLLTIRGKDASSFLHRIVTQSIVDLKDWEVKTAFLLDPNGKLVSGGWVTKKEGEEFLLVTPKEWGLAMVEGLKKYHLRENLSIELSPQEGFLGIFSIDPIPEEKEGKVHLHPSGLELFLPPPWKGWGVRFFSHEEETISQEDLDRYRIPERIPLLGVDLLPGMIPLSAHLKGGFSFTKGCYVGQEVIERMESRKRIGHLLESISLSNFPPTLPYKTPNLLITSAVKDGDKIVALAYLPVKDGKVQIPSDLEQKDLFQKE